MRGSICIAAIAIMASACAGTSPPPAPLEPAVEDVRAAQESDRKQRHEQRFLRYDLNGDGLITSYEARQFNRAEFAKLSPSEDGLVSSHCSIEEYAELSNTYAPQHPELRACFRDVDGSTPTISFADYDRLFKLDADMNSDELISRQEFDAYFASE